jgi:PqqD family protein of HPr-rel-A system
LVSPALQPAEGGPAWRVNPLVDLHLKVWGNSCLAFEAVSGETTVVDALYAASLAQFGGAVRTPAELAAALAQELGVAETQALRDEVNDAIAEFASRGWLEAATLAA